ncbi:MAG: Gfo/Idh/MocA family protein [Bacteroidota bacterium]|jgi:predicted dehydrogenase|nr:Gfo/Idh/MocA family oxidoreductase [Ignavibacteria bacterium]MCU7500180.1 Gfo/Idh/MocA family oxidoreductase [Ignavibacteria bacterium]MCU7513687.1 Gfo/Idh/MocA family oxidoreductase [Ignavibacteria bacterium]MCU7522231.1 Gfo/Idh/MocA family oxidoreductase [Ignavibacteria bacterium]MCU7524987.1 Gfo/Idh/MocA family oxidoreductase [Ignavibacteria bacterium]
MEKLKLGIIGTGHLGKLHIKISKTIPGCELAGIFDMDAEKAKECGSEFNVNVFNSLDEILAATDAVSIVATTSAHYELAKKALEAGRHVFVEKPITKLISEAEELVQLAEKKSLNLQVGHIERFNPALLSLDNYKLEPKFIQSDRLAQFNPRGTDVAVVLDLMIHDIDIILSLVKSDVKHVHASGVAVVSDNIDIANARLEFENGAVANVTASRISQKKMRKMRMFQRDSYISLDFNTGVSEVYRLVSKDETIENNFISFGEMGIGDKKKQVVYEQPEVKEVNALQYELKLFIDSVLNNTKPVVSGLDGLRALKVAEAIIKEIENSQIK